MMGGPSPNLLILPLNIALPRFSYGYVLYSCMVTLIAGQLRGCQYGRPSSLASIKAKGLTDEVKVIIESCRRRRAKPDATKKTSARGAESKPRYL